MTHIPGSSNCLPFRGPPNISSVHAARSLGLCNVCRSLFVILPFGIFSKGSINSEYLDKDCFPCAESDSYNKLLYSIV